MKQSKLSHVTTEEIATCYLEKGMTQQEVANHFHVSSKLLRTRMKQDGLFIRKGKGAHPSHKSVVWQIPLEELRECYLEKQMTIKEIAKHYHLIDETMLRTRMKLERIPIRARTTYAALSNKKRKQHPKYVPPPGAPRKRPEDSQLYELYVTQGLSLKQIGSLLGVSRSTIHNVLRDSDIPIRKSRFDSVQYPADKWGPGVLWNYRLYQHGAANRGYSFELTEEQFYLLTKGDCYYCGKPPSKRRRTRLVSNGIDRIDNAQGYTLTNSRSCCSLCNYMKGSLSEQEFIAHIRRTVDHLRVIYPVVGRGESEGEDASQ